MKELTLKQWHHGYLGLLIIAAGLVDWKHNHTIRLVCVIVGGIILLDDVLEHTVQAITKTEWYSPLRRLYTVFYVRIGLVRAVNAWLDRAVGVLLG